MDTMQTWYQSLIKPEWAPAPNVFGIAWGFIYPIIFVTFGWVFLQYFRGVISWKIALPFAINLALNLSFTAIQFGLRDQSLSLIWMFLVVGTLAWAIVAIWPVRPQIAWAQGPYLLWGLFATALQASLWWLN